MLASPYLPASQRTHCVSHAWWSFLNEACAQLTRPGSRCVGVSINTAALDDAAAQELLSSTSDALGLPTVDAYRFGAGPLVDALG